MTKKHNIDMHIHTKYSDGSDDCIYILKKMESSGLKIASVTDHDSLGFYENCKWRDLSEEHGLHIVPGIEVTSEEICNINGYDQIIGIEILCYNINPDKFKIYLDKFLNKLHENQNELFDIYKNMCVESGIPEANNWVKDHNFAGNSLYRNIMKVVDKRKKELSKILNIANLVNASVFFRKEIDSRQSNFYFVPKNKRANPSEIITAAAACGGFASLAHFGVYSSSKDPLKFAKHMVDRYNGLNLELGYPLNKIEDQMELYSNFKHKIMFTGGSDFHGKNRKGTYLGQYLACNTEINKVFRG